MQPGRGVGGLRGTTTRPRLRLLPLVEAQTQHAPGLVVAVGEGSTPVRVAVFGEVDLASAAQLRTVLSEATGRGGDVVVDCAGMSFIDACGLGVLATAARRLQDEGHVLMLVGLSPFLRSLLRSTRLDRLLRVEPSATPDREPQARAASA